MGEMADYTYEQALLNEFIQEWDDEVFFLSRKLTVPKGFWRDAQGDLHAIKSMDTGYLENVKQFLKRKLAERLYSGKSNTGIFEKLNEIRNELRKRYRKQRFIDATPTAGVFTRKAFEAQYAQDAKKLANEFRRNYPMHVAVVIKKGQETSSRTLGDWACFTRVKKEDAVTAAMAAIRQWDPKNQQEYNILVGKLTEEVKPMSQFQLVSIAKATAKKGK